MKANPEHIADGSFGITDTVLLLFNEHDTRIALNWEPRPIKKRARRGSITIPQLCDGSLIADLLDISLQMKHPDSLVR